MVLDRRRHRRIRRVRLLQQGDAVARVQSRRVRSDPNAPGRPHVQPHSDRDAAPYAHAAARRRGNLDAQPNVDAPADVDADADRDPQPDVDARADMDANADVARRRDRGTRAAPAADGDANAAPYAPADRDPASGDRAGES